MMLRGWLYVQNGPLPSRGLDGARLRGIKKRRLDRFGRRLAEAGSWSCSMIIGLSA
jgi:hypothetical protein